MQVAFKSSAEHDVAQLSEALSEYKDAMEKLELQKKMLLSQVCSCVCSQVRGSAGRCISAGRCVLPYA